MKWMGSTFFVASLLVIGIAQLVSPVILKVKVNDVKTNSSQVLELNVPDPESIQKLCYKVCADFDFTDVQCGTLLRGTEALYEKEHGGFLSEGSGVRVEGGDAGGIEEEVQGERSGRRSIGDHAEILSYSNFLRPEYFISVSPVYRGGAGRGRGNHTDVVPDVRDMAVRAASNMVGSLGKGFIEEFSTSFSSNPTFSDCLMIAVQEGTVKVKEKRPEKRMWWRERRKIAVVRMIMKLAREGRIKNTRFIFSPKDCLGANVKNLDQTFGYPKNYGRSEEQEVRMGDQPLLR